jgi:hypothetical protein
MMGKEDGINLWQQKYAARRALLATCRFVESTSATEKELAYRWAKAWAARAGYNFAAARPLPWRHAENHYPIGMPVVCGGT